MTSQEDKLDLISKQLKDFTNISKGVSKNNFWIGLGISLITVLATIFVTWGSYKTTLENHIANSAIHLSEKQVSEITLNSENRQNLNREILDKTFARKSDLEKLDKRITKLEEKKYNAN